MQIKDVQKLSQIKSMMLANKHPVIYLFMCTYMEMRNWCKNSHASRSGVELPPFYFIFSTMNFKDGNFYFF